MKNAIFNQQQKTKIGSNTFDLSHQLLTTTGFGILTPIFCEEVVPGDNFKITTAMMGRVSPLVWPIMQQIDYYVHYFYVPNRILWDGWNNFIKPQPVPAAWDETQQERTLPYVNYPAENWKVSDGGQPPQQIVNERALLPNFFGLPNYEDIANADGALTPQISALPFQAYQQIWSEFYRDENLQGEYTYQLQDGDNTGSGNETWNNLLSKLRFRSYPKDYFTSALPAPQKGIEMMLPIGDGEVKLTPQSQWQEPVLGVDFGTGDPVQSTGDIGLDSGSLWDNEQNYLVLDPKGSLGLDFTEASIVNLRRALALQEFLELDARGGTRINEAIYNHFGVRISDLRAQRPEFMGGYKQSLKISEVLQTQASPVDTGQDPDYNTPLGTFAGHGVTIGAGQSVGKYVEEHGYIIGVLSTVPKASYFPALDKKWTKFDRFDYFWPKFEHIGEQAILNQEVKLDGTDAALNTTPFGYTPRYAEYKFINSKISGEYKQALKAFHLGREFDQVPPLNEDFIQIQPGDNSRIFAVTDFAEQYNSLWFQVQHNVQAKRKMRFFGNPKVI